MIVSNNADSLVIELSQYLAPRGVNLSEISKVVVEDILAQNSGVSQLKLAFALRRLSKMKNQKINMNFQDTSNEFDVSGTGKVYVKGFLSKSKPQLFFYKENEEMPSFTLKTSKNDNGFNLLVEYANSPDVITNFKNNKSIAESHYLSRVNYVIDDENKINVQKDFFQKTTKQERQDGLDVKLLDENLVFYYNFFKNIFSESGFEFDGKLSEVDYKLMYLDFLTTLEGVLNDPNEFDIKSVLALVESTILPESDNYKNVKLPEIVKKIISIQKGESLSLKNGYIPFVKNNKNYLCRVVSSKQHLSVDVFSAKYEPLCSYVVCGTNGGFTMFRSTKNKNCLIPACTLHSTGKSLMLNSISEPTSKDLHSVNISLDFLKNSDLSYLSIEKFVLEKDSMENIKDTKSLS